MDARDRDWIEGKKMNGFLAVASGSCEQPLFLQMSYCGGSLDDKPIVLVGQLHFIFFLKKIINEI